MQKKIAAIICVLYLLLLIMPGVYANDISLPEDYISVTDYGARGDGLSDDTKAFQAAINASGKNKGTVYIPKGDYVISSRLNLTSDITVKGSGDASRIIVNNPISAGYVFYGIGVSNVRLEQFCIDADVEATGRLGCFNLCGAASVVIKNITATATYLVWTEWMPLGNGSYKKSRDIQVIDNYINGLSGDNSHYYGADCAIYFIHTENAIASGNRVEHCGHGIAWWGGDSNPGQNGAPENPREAKNIVISSNIVTDVAGGGIWGSMGENLTITNNVVTDCHDVGIDLEGTYYSTVSNNTVYNCNNGGITTFFFSRGTVISGNTVYSDTPKQYAFKIYNSSQNFQNEDILLTGNTFVNTSSEGGLSGGDNCEKIVYENNTFINVFVDQDFNNHRYTKISSNHFLVDKTMDMPFTALCAGITNAGGELVVTDNIVETTAEQPDGTIGIQVVQADNSSVNNNIVSGNIVKGFKTDISVINSSSKKLLHNYIVSDNMLGGGNIKSDGNGLVTYNGNYNSSGAYTFGDVPVTGYWRKGQIIYFNSPDMEGHVGAICVTSGTPGEWKYFGQYYDE